MAANSELELWSLSPDTGTFMQVGTLRVSADGQRLETISGGVRKTAWHFALPPSPAPGTSGGDEIGPCTSCQTGSQADLEEGALSLDEVIPGVRTLGVSRELKLRYRSTHADVRPILPIDAALSVRAAVPQTFSARLTLGGVQQGNELYWSAAGLPENADSVSRLGFPLEVASLPTGRYPYELMLFSNYAQSSIGGGSNGHVLIRNERASAYGAGWTLAGVDRLVIQQGARCWFLAQGDGLTSVFAQVNRPLVVESLNTSRSLVVNGVNTSFVGGGAFTQARNELLNPANFGPLGIVPRAVTLGAGLSTITTSALAGVDVFLLNPINFSQELTASEAVALEEFVKQGGALLEYRDAPQLRPLLLGTTTGPFAADSTADLTVAGLNSALVHGPFGSVSSPLTTGANSSYGTTGSATIIAGNDRGPNVLQLQANGGFSGTWRAAFIGDEEIFANGFVSGASNLYSANRLFFLNTVAFAAGAPGYQPPAPLTSTVVTYQGPPGDYSTLRRNTDGTFTRTLKDGTTQQFTAQGLQTAVSDRNGNTTSYAYDGSGNLTTITDPAGEVTTLTYSGGRLATITDPAHRVTHFQYDLDGNLTRITYADASTTRFEYDSQHRLIRRTDARNQVSQYSYDYVGRFTQSTLPTGETRTLTPSQRLAVPNVAPGQGTSGNPASLAPPINTATFTDARTHTTQFELDALGRVTKQADALNRTTIIQRDAQGNPTSITRPNGVVTTMTYDANGNLLTTTEQAIAATTTFTYEPAFNQVTSINDPLNHTTTITYDARGNPLTITDADEWPPDRARTRTPKPQRPDPRIGRQADRSS